MFLASSRFTFFLAFLVGALVMGCALYLEYGSGLKPCSLCQVQRLFLLVFCLVNLMASVQGPQRFGMWCYSTVSSLLALCGAVIALRQMQLQISGPEHLMSCQPDLACVWHDLSPGEFFSMLYRGSEDCAHIHWTVFDLSAPELSLLAFIGLLVLSIFQIIRSIYAEKFPRGCDVK